MIGELIYIAFVLVWAIAAYFTNSDIDTPSWEDIENQSDISV